MINKVKNNIRVRRSLRLYQREHGLYYAMKEQNPAFFWEMRLGKSLAVLRSLFSRYVSGKHLIVAPYSALYQWTKEFKNEGLTKRDYTFLTGTKSERENNLNTDTMFYLLNKEGWFCIQQIAYILWNSVVLDESTFIKSPKSKVSNFFCDNFRNVDSRWLLTGMPAPESMLDYFQQMKFLDPSIFKYKNFYTFRHELFVQTFRGEYSPTCKGEQFINNRLAKHCSFLTRKDVNLDVEKIFTKRNIKMKVSAWKTMQTLLREFILETDDKLYEVTDSAGAKFHLARRICGGFVKDDFIFFEKINALIDLLKSELANQQIIIYAEYLSEIDMICKILNKEEITNNFIYGKNRKQRFEILDSFTSGKIQVLEGLPSCFKHGVDLSCSDTIVYYSLPMANETFGQSQDRIINVSKRFPAHLISLVCEHTIEEDIYLSMINKESREQLQKRIVKRIREEMK